MNAKNHTATIKTLWASVVVSALALTISGATGCEKLTSEQAAALTSQSAAPVSGQAEAAGKSELLSRMIII